MLNQIQLHIHENEEKQLEVEEKFSKEIHSRQKNGIEAFRRYIPSLLPTLTRHNNKTSTVFCNKHGEVNIIDYLSGQVVYGEFPALEVAEHLKRSEPEANTIFFSKDHLHNAVIVLGLGLGLHIESLVYSRKYKYIIVYEPSLDHLTCSASAIDWRSVLNFAQQHGISLFLQIGQNGRTLYKDIQELRENLPLDSICLYKHFNSPTFDHIQEIWQKGDWHKFEKQNISNSLTYDVVNYIPPWTLLNSENEWLSSKLCFKTKERNLKALEKFFPTLFDEYKDYVPQGWSPVADSNGQINICRLGTEALFYSENPKDECERSFEQFRHHPHKDGLLLGYKGTKLRNYLHYRMVADCQSILESVEDVKGELPEKLRALIVMGLGNGYTLNSLTERHKVDKLFICEPNRDFFYASLFCVNWSAIFEEFDQSERRIYLNIGDDGSNLTDDLLIQFQSIGPYVLANTYFYQGYYNEGLVRAISQLREQLQVIIAMGDYFDNAKYGLSHTIDSITSDVPFLRNTFPSLVNDATRNVPIFVVGNGPSLDNLLPYLKQEREKAIVISCGTALQSLYKNNIVPDFHAEIEMNRATHDWAVRIGDKAYLKEIVLLSCNGIHPDTRNLYKSTLLAFKQGEASTVALMEAYGKHDFKLLEHAYPTVSNFVIDLVASLGLQQVYLLGIDLGFVSEKYHHSKSSGYYLENGQELYAYSDTNNTSVVVPGNLRPWVSTKFEFKVSKSVIEQRIAKSKADFYNLNDGARIVGASPLKPENLLILSTPSQKDALVASVCDQAFKPLDKARLTDGLTQRFSKPALLEEFDSLITLCDENDVDSHSSLEAFIDLQREFIVSSLFRKKSQLFFLLNGTLNYINSVMSKLLDIQDEALLCDTANQLKSLWKRYVQDMQRIMDLDELGSDGSGSFYALRRKVYIQKYAETSGFNIHVVPKVNEVWLKEWQLLNRVCDVDSQKRDPIVVNFDDEEHVLERVNCKVSSNIEGVLRSAEYGDTVVFSLDTFCVDKDVCLLPPKFDQINHALNVTLSSIGKAIVIPKLLVLKGYCPDGLEKVVEAFQERFVYETQDFVVLTETLLKNDQRVLTFGDRLSFRPRLMTSSLTVLIKTEKAFKDVVALKKR
ncbi:6-hydroxymethylpterin diphosphokinase MptE-like protein [Alteromonas mediterranea]|uniref:6-hydroxymethylpterin diphosphokinase MptE-like protein n=1 Tax=Alteromonas mediterranea TaxID=314275 RepID=UPI0012FB6FF4|nr:6-hydroxymethylpterin diphosphokinase MptE-like protein [Alteromonas mediterranea]QGX61024.1 DUF115 domain-containing protein [Alteromonas mediterranea]